MQSKIATTFINEFVKNKQYILHAVSYTLNSKSKNYSFIQKSRCDIYNTGQPNILA